MSRFGVKKRLNFRFWPTQFWWRPFFFFFWRPPVFGLKKRLNFRFWPKSQTQFRWKPFFFLKKRLNFRAFREISSQFSDKPFETDSRTMKIRVKVACTFLTLSPPPPLSKSWLRVWFHVPSVFRSTNMRFYLGYSTILEYWLCFL